MVPIYLVCGSRKFKDKDWLFSILTNIYNKTPFVLLHGGMRGVDVLARRWAETRGVTHITHFTDWAKNHKDSELTRNEEMFERWNPELVLAFPGDKGTQSLLELAYRKNVPILDVVEFNNRKTQNAGNSQKKNFQSKIFRKST